MSKTVSTPNYEMAVNLLATIQILQQIFVKSVPGRLVKISITLLAGLNQVWLTSRFCRFLEQLSRLAAASFTGRFLSADPWSRLQTQTGSSLFLRLWRHVAGPLSAARRAWTARLAGQVGSSITVAILSHLACPEGWQLSGIVRAGLAFGLGLGLGLALFGLLTPVTVLLPVAILGAYLLWRDTPATVQAVWQDSLPGKAVTALLAEPDETAAPAVIAPALTGAARYLMYGLLLLFGLFTGYLWHRFQTPYVLALPVALALVQLIILRPAAGLWAVAFYAEIDWFFRYKCQVFGLPGWWDEALLVLMVFAVGARWLTARDFTWRTHPTLFPLTAFIAIIVTLFLIDDHYLRISVPLEGFRVVVQHLLWFYLAVQLVRSRPQAKGLLTGFVVLCTGIAVYGLYQYVTKVPMPAMWVDQAEGSILTRAYSVVGSPNVLGSLLVLATPAALGFAYRGTTGQRLFYLACAVIMGLGLLCTFTRGAWLAFAFALVMFGALQDRRLIAALLVGLILLPVVAPSVGDRFSYLLSPDYFKKSAQTGGRLDRWAAAVEHVRENPLTGAGLGRYGGAAAENNKLLLPHKTTYTDNYYLKTAAETGLIGLFAFIALMFAVVRLGIGCTVHAPPAYRPVAAGLAAGLAGVVLHNCVENVFEVPLMVVAFWFLVALIWVFRTGDLSPKHRPPSGQNTPLTR